MKEHYLSTLIIGICIPVFFWFIFVKKEGWKKLKEGFKKTFYRS